MNDEQIIEYGRSFPALLEVLTREPARVAFVQCQRALLSASKPAAPEGWKLVPVVMTAAMINAWSNGNSVSSDEVAVRTPFQDAWSRVLAAISAAPSDTQDERERFYAQGRQDGVRIGEARAALAAAPAQSGEPIYQIEQHNGSWLDVSEDAYESTEENRRRIVYAAPQPSPSAVAGLSDLHKELNKITWMGADEGWDRAIDAVRNRIVEMLEAK